MAYVLPKEKQIAVIAALAEGSSIRAIERITGVNRNIGQTVWEGEVEVFDLHDHPETHRVYAWSHETEDVDHPRRHVTVLHVPPATSPRKAVQASIVSDYRERKDNAED
jgi:hypothetical protein